VLASTGIALVPLALSVARRIAPRQGVFFARWGFSHVGLLLLGGLVVLQLTRLLVPGEITDMKVSLLRGAIFMGALAAGTLALARKLHPEGIGALGFARGGNVRAIIAGVVCFVILWPPLYGAMMVWPELARGIGIETGTQPVLEGILVLEGAPLVLAVVFATLVGPLFEELVFRGFLQPLLVQNFRESGGIVICALFFALLHGTDVFLPLFLFSLLLGWLQVHTHRLLAPYCVHVLNNSLTLLLAFHQGFPT